MISVLILLAKVIGGYLAVGLMFWLLFKKEIQIRRNLTVYNFLMKDKNQYHYGYKGGGKTVSILLVFYLVFHLLSMRKLVMSIHIEDRVDEFINQVERFILDNRESPYLVTINKTNI